jgi:hypothetical protein
MEIPVKQILKKMELEIQQALGFEDAAKVREHVLVVESLCELILEQGKQSTQHVKELVPTTPIKKQSNTIENDSEANGESLFDF